MEASLFVAGPCSGLSPVRGMLRPVRLQTCCGLCRTLVALTWEQASQALPSMPLGLTKGKYSVLNA